MEERLKQTKRGINSIRALLSLVILLLGIYNAGAIIESAGFIFFYIAIVIISNVFFIMLPEKMYEGMKLHYIIFILDIILVCFGAYWLGGVSFKMLMVIFLAVFMAALSQSVGMSLVIAAVTTAVYVIISSTGRETGFAGLFQEKEILNIPFIFVVSLHASFIAEKANQELEEKKKVRQAYGELAEQFEGFRGDIHTLNEFHSRVYDSLKQAVIVTDASGAVKVFNSRAEEIFGIRRGKAVNLNVNHQEGLSGPAKLLNELMLKKQPSDNKEISVIESGTVKKLRANTGKVKDRDGNIIGYIFSAEQFF
ncbi:MAG: sensory histidine kinase AtoS [Candidatus Aerophobetes bacterium ADurb.Bin490]|nr:MAG: sensory histidine kinase AtoS [Candidatus Aerophobetes bacterium ADurb.Bin490]HPI02579.1 PAS domain-containing protein [Candidatus Goldiibacteriota bacterium]HPN63762.1 PAS domain-containing protein [Candidatus Goldiibacteriota bacterium]HRQ43446.1 PAS domain-containing protein [Candidatus Goldiibacteriota bacterium]